MGDDPEMPDERQRSGDDNKCHQPGFHRYANRLRFQVEAGRAICRRVGHREGTARLLLRLYQNLQVILLRHGFSSIFIMHIGR